MMRNPVFESSMKRRMRSWRAPLLMTLYGLFLLLVCTGALNVMQKSAVTLGNQRIGLETYVYLSVMQFALVVLVAPALTSGAISGERERQTLDLLLCTRTGALRIVLGKLFSSACFLVLMLVSSLPMMGLVFVFGGVSLADVLLMLLFLTVTALACSSIGIFCSAVFKRTVTATVVAYLIIFALGVATLIVPLMLSATGAMSMIFTPTATSATTLLAGGMSMLLLNPAVGLAALLVEQTGLLAGLLDELSYWLREVGVLMSDGLQVMAWLNMGVLAVCSVVLMLLSALFVKPTGKRVRKRK